VEWRLNVQIIPAVDIKGGKVVRLLQGQADKEVVYPTDPVSAAKRWQQEGAERLHLVDLDGAFEGRPCNADWTKRILREVRIEVEIGGGLRSIDAVREFMEAGAARCVIGTKAVEDRSFLADLARSWPQRIIVGIDAKAGQIMTRGWLSGSSVTAADLLSELYDLPLGEVIYTDIERDGLLGGPNYEQIREILRASPFPVISSGGVCSIDHVERLRNLGCSGCIIGKAFYDGKLTFAEARKAGEAKRRENHA
jgi:phosphoribosylformimino-5-aminoimidazole carboxamide ribotide isomerase